MGAAGFIRLVRRNFMTTLPEKRNDEEGNTYQRGVPENKRTQQSISGRRSEQISYAGPEIQVRTPESQYAVMLGDMGH